MAKSAKTQTDAERLKDARDLAEKAKQMQARHLQTAAKIQARIDASDAAQLRADDTRRKILLGVHYLGLLKAPRNVNLRTSFGTAVGQMKEEDRVLFSDLVAELEAIKAPPATS